MSKPFDYSKWDNIELSDDEDDCHPNIDKESWFRMKHRSRVEREENEDKDKEQLLREMEKANQRIKVIQHDLAKMEKRKQDDSDSDDDDDLDDTEGLQAELQQLTAQNKARQEKLDEYEKNKKWNVDNMFQVKEERTMINPKAGEETFTSTGYAQPKDEELKPKAAKPAATTKSKDKKEDEPKKTNVFAKTNNKQPVGPSPPPSASGPDYSNHNPPKVEAGVMETYPEFVEKYAETVELFMQIPDLEGSKEFLLKYGDILLQENASNYLLLASLEDEMNGHHEKMKITARQSQIVSHIAELAKTMKTHPGNVIMPFFTRLQQKEHLMEFLHAVQDFCAKIVQRAKVKKAEMDAQRAAEDGDDELQPRELADIPREERLGPGGLDPLEVVKTLPDEMVKAFESRDVQALQAALMKMEPDVAEKLMKDCVASGLWVANA